MSDWKPDGSGVRPGGDVGGDVQATESHSVRYRHVRHRGAVVTVYVFGQSSDGRAFQVTTMTEHVVCDDVGDPGGTERWAEITYVTGPEKYSAKNIHQAVRRIAERHRPDQIQWDGRAPWEKDQ
ncbi:hypothetical protein [Actinomadura sp. NBRC 104412]|uniref:hypothetical protein n=1 Tax=Actinomadura sp. NBRC 104412 TaxID=3032203 RepID=UPI002552407F|nr:hypothetical protein [Actinomadura sp. NBRC 104412]